MNAARLRATCRAEIFDVAEPYLVSDILLQVYLDDAQKMFCRLTQGIEDARTFSIRIRPDVEWYPIDPLILKMRAVTSKLTGRPVATVAMEKAADAGIYFDGRVGPLKALVTGAEKNMVRAWPMPAVEEDLAMAVFRLPYDLADSAEPEIDPQHHLALLEWVKHRIYSNHDSELFNAVQAGTFKNTFTMYCEKAKTEQTRARHSAGVVSFGGL